MSELNVHSAREVGALSSRDSHYPGPATAAAQATLPALELGQEIMAEVVDQLADGRIVLQLGGALIEAENPGQLYQGQLLRLQVEQLQPQVILHILGQEPTLEVQLKNLLLQRLPAGEMVSVTELQQALNAELVNQDRTPLGSALEKLKFFLSAVLPQGGNWTAERLRQFVREFGLQYEAKLLRAVKAGSEDLGAISDHDLKGLLLQLLEELPSTLLSSDSLDRVERKLHDIEGQQASNLLARLKGEALQLRVPLVIGQAAADVAISINADGARSADRQGQKKSGYQIYFALDLENFGRTRIDLHVHENDVRGIFYIDRESSLAQLTRALPELQAAFRNQGYRGVSLAARPLRELTAELEETFAALLVGVPPQMHLVNRKV
ncbi:MAG TPA: flagellar hook-length control protein FliK [Candidatus Binatia bacterium]